MTTNAFTGSGASFATRVVTNPDADIVSDRTVTSRGSYNATAPTNGGAWVMQVATFK